MSKTKILIGSGIFAILVLIGFQIYSLLRIYNLETEKFDYKYHDLILKGIAQIEEKRPGFALETANKSLDIGAKVLLSIMREREYKDTLTIRKYALKDLHNRFFESQDLDLIVKKLLEQEDIKPIFSSHIIFKKLEIYDGADELNVYDQELDKNWIYADTLNIPDKSMYISGYENWGDHFYYVVDYLIDFENKRGMVLRNMLGIFFMIAFSLLVVAGIFLITLRNMIEEKRLSELKTDFINNMTHELKTPLSTIAIATKSLQNRQIAIIPEKVLDTAEMISRQNKQLSNQINHLLEVSMWERNQFDLDKQWVDLHEFLFALVKAFKWEQKNTDLSITAECYGIEDIEIFMDETQMSLAIHNLLTNAVKYTDVKPEIILRCQKTDKLYISIVDNGIGVSKEHAKHIFDKFYRVSTGNIHKVKGLGLGLFYVKQIVEAHNGEISLTSKPGKGSTFTIKLPANGRKKNSSG